MINAYPASLGAVVVVCWLARIQKRINGYARVQKEMYLLKQLGVQELADVCFRFHEGGPLSYEVDDAIYEAVERRMLVREEHPETKEETFSAGPEVAREDWLFNQESKAELERVARLTQGLSIKALTFASMVLHAFRNHAPVETAKARSLPLLRAPIDPSEQEAAINLLTDLGLLAKADTNPSFAAE